MQLPVTYFYTLLVLILAGWIITLYFFQVYRNRIPRKVWWIPPLIQMGSVRCVSIVDSSYGTTLGRPNAFWGLWYYGLLFLLVLADRFVPFSIIPTLLVISGLTLIFSFYLTWGLIQLQVRCRPCLSIHTINFLIFLISCRLLW
jgi:uncharacterized membrane protein